MVSAGSYFFLQETFKIGDWSFMTFVTQTIYIIENENRFIGIAMRKREKYEIKFSFFWYNIPFHFA